MAAACSCFCGAGTHTTDSAPMSRPSSAGSSAGSSHTDGAQRTSSQQVHDVKPKKTSLDHWEACLQSFAAQLQCPTVVLSTCKPNTTVCKGSKFPRFTMPWH